MQHKVASRDKSVICDHWFQLHGDKLMKSLVIILGTHASYAIVGSHFDLKCASVLLVMFFLSIFAAFLFLSFWISRGTEGKECGIFNTIV
jgi:Ca2+/Na+ antiporter